jgi:hypothetical protein
LCDSRLWKAAPLARWYSITTSRWPNIQSPRNVTKGTNSRGAPGSVAGSGTTS